MADCKYISHQQTANLSARDAAHRVSLFSRAYSEIARRVSMLIQLRDIKIAGAHVTSNLLSSAVAHDDQVQIALCQRIVCRANIILCREGRRDSKKRRAARALLSKS